MMTMIAALDNKNGIAGPNGIPWTLPTDQQFFSDQIREGIILMGYGTYQEIDAPLHDRVNYVASRQQRTLRTGFCQVVAVEQFVRDHQAERIKNIGGAHLFTSGLSLADELILTRIDGDFGCTKFFPRFDTEFALTSESDPVDENGSRFTFQTWHRHR